MQCMVTVTHMDNVPEIRAPAREGCPFARPTQEDMIAHLLTRTRKGESAVQCTDLAMEHVLSYQRRVLAIKKEFLTRGKPSPLGVVVDFVDRTEVRAPPSFFPSPRESTEVHAVAPRVCLHLGAPLDEPLRAARSLAPLPRRSSAEPSTVIS